MKARVLLLVILLVISSSPGSLADWEIAENVTQRSTIFLRGYMDELMIYQTEEGVSGSKLVYGSRGSGTASRTVTSYVDECEISFKVEGVFDYHPYEPETSESDLRRALRAKNLEVGAIISESYTGAEYLIEDRPASQKNEAGIYQISSQGQNAAFLGGW